MRMLAVCVVVTAMCTGAGIAVFTASRWGVVLAVAGFAALVGLAGWAHDSRPLTQQERDALDEMFGRKEWR